MKKALIGLIFIVAVFACSEKSPDCGDPAPTKCELVLKDAQNHFLVGSIYDRDSIGLSVGGHQIPLDFDSGIIIFNFAGLDSLNSLDYILILNNEDSDTMNLRIRKYINPCWTGFLLDSLSYNKTIMANITANRFEIIK